MNLDYFVKTVLCKNVKDRTQFTASLRDALYLRNYKVRLFNESLRMPILSHKNPASAWDPRDNSHVQGRDMRDIMSNDFRNLEVLQ